MPPRPGSAFISTTRQVDLHVWRVGKQFYSCVLSLVTKAPTLTPTKVREQLGGHKEIVLATISVHYRLPT